MSGEFNWLEEFNRVISSTAMLDSRERDALLTVANRAGKLKAMLKAPGYLGDPRRVAWQEEFKALKRAIAALNKGLDNGNVHTANSNA